MAISNRLFGLDTEYGLWIEGKGPDDLAEESRKLVQAYQGCFAAPWDYGSEDPRRDMRGFRVDKLNYDPKDAQYDKPGAAKLSHEEDRSDHVLPNGGRFYNDHGHPEYATPECRSLKDLVAHDKAGERIVLATAQARSARLGVPIQVFKNNSDHYGASYGAHESYLVRRDLSFETLFNGLMPMFVTRQVYAGAGKVGRETEGPLDEECVYQLSQRADFFSVEASVDTLYQRPIFNTRDEAHADPRQFRRLHVICGDSNLCEYATALKIGAVCLTLELLESGWEPLIRIRKPVEAIKRISRDPTLKWMVELTDGRTMDATDIQRVYLKEAQHQLAGRDADTDWTLAEWERILNDLDEDPWRAEDRIDWVAKRKLLQSFMQAAEEEGCEEIGWSEETLKSLDLAYHNLDPEEGLYAALEQNGAVARLVEEAEVQAAIQQPPRDTRARIRGELVRRFTSQIERVSWGRIQMRDGSEATWLSLHGLEDASVAQLAARVEKTEKLADIVRLIRGAQ